MVNSRQVTAAEGLTVSDDGVARARIHRCEDSSVIGVVISPRIAEERLVNAIVIPTYSYSIRSTSIGPSIRLSRSYPRTTCRSTLSSLGLVVSDPVRRDRLLGGCEEIADVELMMHMQAAPSPVSRAQHVVRLPDNGAIVSRYASSIPE